MAITTRTFGLTDEWGLTKIAIRVRDSTVPFLGNLAESCSISMTQTHDTTEIQCQSLEPSLNASGNGIQIQWNTTETVDTSGMGEGNWYYRGEEINLEAIPYMEESALVEVAFLVPRMHELAAMTYRQHSIACCRQQVRFQLNEACLWVPGRASTDMNSWGPTFFEAMVSGIGPINCPAFTRFMDIGRRVYGYNPLRVYRTVFGCRADFMHEALLKSDLGKEFLDLQKDVLKNPHHMLGLKNRALAWLDDHEHEPLQCCVPWWLLDSDNNFEEILETPRTHMFMSARRTDTSYDDSAAWVAAKNLGITRITPTPNGSTAKKRKSKKGKQLPPELLSGLQPRNIVVEHTAN